MYPVECRSEYLSGLLIRFYECSRLVIGFSPFLLASLLLSLVLCWLYVLFFSPVGQLLGLWSFLLCVLLSFVGL